MIWFWALDPTLPMVRWGVLVIQFAIERGTARLGMECGDRLYHFSFSPPYLYHWWNLLKFFQFEKINMENHPKRSGISIRGIWDEGWRDEDQKSKDFTFMIKETTTNCTCTTNPVTSSDLVKMYGRSEVCAMLGRYASELAKEASTPEHSLHEYAKNSSYQSELSWMRRDSNSVMFLTQLWAKETSHWTRKVNSMDQS